MAETMEREYRQRGRETDRRNAGERNASSSRLPRIRAPDPSEPGGHAGDNKSYGEDRNEHGDYEIAEGFSDDEGCGGGEGHRFTFFLNFGSAASRSIRRTRSNARSNIRNSS